MYVAYLLLLCCCLMTAAHTFSLSRLNPRLSRAPRPATQLVQMAEIIERQGRSIQALNQAVFDLQQERLLLQTRIHYMAQKLITASAKNAQLKGENRNLTNDLLRANARSV